MYVAKQQSTEQLLSIDDAKFASVIAVNDDSVDVNVTFFVSQSSVIKQRATSVNVYVKTKSASKSSVLSGVKDRLSDNKKLLRNILINSQLAKSAITQKDVGIIESKRVSTLVNVNKRMLGRMCSVIEKLGGAQLSTLTELYERRYSIESVSSLRNAYVDKPLLDRYNVVPTFEDYQSIDCVSERRNMLFKHRIDPSLVTLADANSAYSYESLCGLTNSRVNLRYKNVYSINLLNDVLTDPVINDLSTKDLRDDDVIVNTQMSYIDNKKLSVVLTIPIDPESQTLNVVIDALDLNGNVLESKTKKLDITNLTINATLPKSAPLVADTIVSKKSFTTLHVNLNDKHADYVTVYKKSISNVTPRLIDDGYELVYDKLPTHAGNVDVSIDATNVNSTNVYRIIPHGQSKTMSSHFTNVIVSPDRYKLPKIASVTTYSTRNGVIVEVRSFPRDVVSVNIQRKDLTLREKTYTYVGTTTLTSKTSSEALFFVDSDSLKEFHVYEYVAKLTYKSGLTCVAGSSVIEYLTFIDGIVTKLSDLAVSYPDLDVTFSVNTSILSTNTDDVKLLLEKQGMLNYFNNDILNDRNKLQSLIAHNITRVNLTLGIKEDFGVVTDANFSDRAMRSVSMVSDLNQLCDYRYEIAALIRSPETLLESYVKTSVDKSTNKTYKYSPIKFLHPNTLNKGSISNVETTRLRHSKKNMMFGKVGNIEKVDVSFEKNDVSMTDLKAYQQDYSTVIISWKIDGVQSRIDHFIISKMINNVKRVVGKSHPHFANGNCKFLLKLENEDKGDISFIVMPILNDYSNASEYKTNTLRIL
jgi:hypothetical protein